MTQYINKANLVAEIERLITELVEEGEDTMFEQGRISAFEDVKVFINHTLEVKEIDSEEKATQLSQKYFPDEENIWARSNIEAHKCKNACIEMVEWFKAQKGE